MISLLQYLLCFLVFVVLQSWFINGIREAFTEGNILYRVRIFLSKYISEFWGRSLYSCVKCMASFWGAVTFFPFVIYLFGFRWEEIVVYFFNVGALSFLNNLFYKRV